MNALDMASEDVYKQPLTKSRSKPKQLLKSSVIDVSSTDPPLTLTDILEPPEEFAPKVYRVKVMPKMSSDMESILSSFEEESTGGNAKELKEKESLFMKKHSNNGQKTRRRTIDYTGRRDKLILAHHSHSDLSSTDNILREKLKDLSLNNSASKSRPRGLSMVTEGLLLRKKRLNDNIDRLKNRRNHEGPGYSKGIFSRSKSENDKELSRTPVTAKRIRKTTDPHHLPMFQQSLQGTSRSLSSDTFTQQKASRGLRSDWLSQARNHPLSSSLQERFSSEKKVTLPAINRKSLTSMTGLDSPSEETTPTLISLDNFPRQQLDHLMEQSLSCDLVTW